MRLSRFYPLLILLTACHSQGPQVKEDVVKDTVNSDSVTMPQVNHDFEADNRVFDNFRDSVAEQMELTNRQRSFYLKDDTTGPYRPLVGHELRRLGNMYLMIINFEYGSYKLYTLDSASYTLLDHSIIGYNSDADGGYGGSSCDYEFVNDSTIEIVEKDFAPEGSKQPEQLVRTTFTISSTGKITETHNNQ
ncbi:MAG: hypothetical protein H6Q26_2596 [Bacteroidetes bacterium]|nr:hypothetical protein [Bacteroidota bacterium]